MATSVREKNKLDKKRKILKTAFTLFAYKGFEKTTISDIVEAADIGRGTFYNYFKSTKEVLKRVIEKLNVEISEVLNESLKNSTTMEEYIFNSLKSYFDAVSTEEMIHFHRNNQKYIRGVTYGDKMKKSIISTLHNNFLKTTDIHFENEENFKLLSFALASSAIELFISSNQGYFKATNEEMAKFITDIYMRGIPTKTT